MQRISVVLIFFCYLFSVAVAQTRYSDSLEKFIATAPPDTNKVNAMNLYAYDFRNNDPKKCISYSEKTLALANKLNYEKGVGAAELAIGTAYSTTSEHQIALSHLSKALGIFEKIKDKRNLGRTYNNLANIYKAFGNYEEAKNKYNTSLKIFEEIGNDEGVGFACNNLGSVFLTETNFPLALKYLNQALDIRKKTGNKLQLADTYYMISLVQSNQGDYSEALKCLFNVLKIREEFDDKIGISDCYGSIGVIYTKMGNYKDAEEKELKSLEIATRIDDKLGIGNATFNLGNICLYQKKSECALKYYGQSLQAKEIIGDRSGIAGTYANIAEAYRLQNNFQGALKNAELGLKYYEALNIQDGVAISKITLGSIYTSLKRFKEAKECFDESLVIAKRLKSKEIMRDSYLFTVQLDSMQGNYTRAFDNYKKYVLYKDSLVNEENTKRVVQAQMQYEFDKKETEAKAEQEKKDIRAKEEQNQQKLVRNSFIVGFLLMILLAGITFRNYRRKQKDNQTITKQKEVVEEKNREITQSIEYALRIQTAILPPESIFKLHLPGSFILYLPKDIVAGDFYWMEISKDLVLFAACDCTGHGVPGAMVSVICHNALNRSVREFGLTSPAAILDKTAEIVIENFAQSENQIKDGMDISLCVFNKKTKELNWAGANNPLWIIRNGEIIETKADKQPIGMYDHSKLFTMHSFQLEHKDRIYLFTDGFADQFGGEKEKKLTRKSFKDLLVAMNGVPISEQGRSLNEFISDYRSNLDQIDDILVIGVEV